MDRPLKEKFFKANHKAYEFGALINQSPSVLTDWILLENKL